MTHHDLVDGVAALLRPMVRRGGLRADILSSGVVHVGDAIGA